jgi:hypothetical protein
LTEDVEHLPFRIDLEQQALWEKAQDSDIVLVLARRFAKICDLLNDLRKAGEQGDGSHNCMDDIVPGSPALSALIP